MDNKSSEEQIVTKVECKNIITNAILRSLIYLVVLVSVGVILTLYKTTGKVNYTNSADVNYIYVVVACVLLSAIFMTISILSALHKKVEFDGTTLTIFGGVLQTTSKTINVSNIKNVQFSSNKFCTKLQIEYLTDSNLYTASEGGNLKNANHAKSQSETTCEESQNSTNLNNSMSQNEILEKASPNSTITNHIKLQNGMQDVEKQNFTDANTSKLQNEVSDKENQNLTSAEGVYLANSKANELTKKESEIPHKGTRTLQNNTQFITLTDLNNLDLLYTALNAKHIQVIK